MAKTTYLDDLIEFKHSVIAELASSRDVVGLLLNNPYIDMESDAAYEITNTHIYDFDYVDHTVQRTDAYVMVDGEMMYPTSGSMNKWYLYVQVICEKTYNKLDHKIFKGVKGNRRDNLIRQIDVLLNGSDQFGIGKLELVKGNIATVPDSFTSYMLTYEIHDFRKERLVRGR